MQARFFVSLFALGLVFLPDPVCRVAHATTDMPADIEKLFVFPAEKCSFYPELGDRCIRRMDRFPFPGTISFNLTLEP